MFGSYFAKMAQRAYKDKLARRILDKVDNQTRNICLGAVRKNGYEIEFVKQQIEELCIAAMTEDRRACYFIRPESITEKVALTMVGCDEGLIAGFTAEQQSEAVCQYAVSRRPTVISAVINQTEKLCWRAVKADPCALEGVRKRNPKICRYAFERKAETIRFCNACRNDCPIYQDKQYVDNKYYQAIKENIFMIKLIENPTEEMQMLAVTE
jgi:hypothetical protein